jgi:hypothetical protein
MHILLEVKSQNNGLHLFPSSRKLIAQGGRRGAWDGARALLHIEI